MNRGCRLPLGRGRPIGHRSRRAQTRIQHRLVRGPRLLWPLPRLHGQAARRPPAHLHARRISLSEGKQRFLRHEPLHRELHQAQDHRARRRRFPRQPRNALRVQERREHRSRNAILLAAAQPPGFPRLAQLALQTLQLPQDLLHGEWHESEGRE